MPRDRHFGPLSLSCHLVALVSLLSSCFASLKLFFALAIPLILVVSLIAFRHLTTVIFRLNTIVLHSVRVLDVRDIVVRELHRTQLVQSTLHGRLSRLELALNLRLILVLGQYFREGHSLSDRLEDVDHLDGKVWLEVGVAAVRSRQVPVLHMVDEVLVERHLLVHLHRGGEGCKFIVALITMVVVGVEEHLVDDDEGNFTRALAPLPDLVET